jgi:hypothetical protein
MAENYTKTSKSGYIAGSYGVYGTPFGSVATFTGRNYIPASDTFAGTKNPFYRSQIRGVTSATTPAGGEKYRLNVVPGVATRTWKTSLVAPPVTDPYLYDRFNQTFYTIRVVPGVAPDVTGGAINTIDSRAIATLYQQLNSIESTVSAGEDLGELAQTARLLRSPLKSLRSLLTSTVDSHNRALRIPNVSKVAKALADTALEYRFGIKPLVSTIAGAMVGLQNRAYLAHYYPVNATASDTQVDGYTSDQIFAGNLSIDTVTRSLWESSVRYHGVYGVQSSVNTRGVDDVLSLRWRDVVPTIWNLIPYSFLADYVTNIGDIVDSLSVPWSGVRWMVRTVRTTSSREAYTLGYHEHLPAFKIGGNCGNGNTTVIVRKFSRQQQSILPRPTLEIDLKLSSGQLFNVAALLVSKAIPIAAKTDRRASSSSLAAAFNREVGRQNLRVPYPFHSS